MISIGNTEVFGFESAVRGSRNPLNSWAKSDSCFEPVELGINDLNLLTKLATAGADHGKFLRMIHVQCDILAPLYWWKEMDTYKIGTVANSTSTMHKLHSKEITIDDFSTDHMTEEGLSLFALFIEGIEALRIRFLDTMDKNIWYTIIQLLPSSYNQLRTFDVNYEALRNIYHARKNHKLEEWHTFCDWVETLPYADELIVKGRNA